MDFLQAVETLRRGFSDSERARLRRILMRAQADCESPKTTAGTGGQSTRKRALALQLALDGVALDAIAGQTALTPQRVERVLANVAGHGFAALDPAFAETMNDGEHPTTDVLAAMLAPILTTAPRHRGYNAAMWTPASLLDCLIGEGMLHDSSVGAIESTIRSSFDASQAPLTFSYTEHGVADEVQPKAYVKWLVLAAGPFVIFMGSPFFATSSDLPCAGFPVILFGLLFTYGACISIYRDVQEANILASVITQEPLVPPVPSAPARRSNRAAVRAPAAEIVIGHHDTLPRPAWKLDALSETASATGARPPSILYLWVFRTAASRQPVYETQGWAQVGPVHLLLNCSALTAGDLRKATGMLMRDPAELAANVARYTDVSGNHPRPSLFQTMDRKGPYRGYPIHTLVCTDDVWQNAFHAFAGRTDLAVFNLSGYTPGAGLEFELRQVLAGGPPKQFVFMYDRYTDADGAIDSVLSVWDEISEYHGTTNKLIFLRYSDPQDVGYGTQFQKPSGLLSGLAARFLRREGDYHPVAGTVSAFVAQDVSRPYQC